MIYRLLHNDEQAITHDLIRQFCIETNAGVAAWKEIIARTNMNIAVAENGSLAGCAGYYVLGDKAIFDFLYVLPEYRNGMVGGRLHKMGTEHAKAQGVKTIVIFTYPETAQRYLKIGYKTKFHVVEKEV
jgi:N-acetylglutamate synthase-like GNAT family acetyltransferase